MIPKDESGEMMRDSVPDATSSNESIMKHFSAAADKDEDKAAASSGSFRFLAFPKWLVQFLMQI